MSTSMRSLTDVGAANLEILFQPRADLLDRPVATKRRQKESNPRSADDQRSSVIAWALRSICCVRCIAARVRYSASWVMPSSPANSRTVPFSS